MSQEALMSDRKYRQSGYQDDEPREKRSRPSGPREKSDKPRGRGLGKPTKSVFRCSRCGHSYTVGQDVALDATCSGCGDDLHACTNCTHFDSSAPMECRQPIAERISKKSKRNECELFEPKTTQEFAKESPPPDDARAAFDALFKL
jgi:hypothetical protein